MEIMKVSSPCQSPAEDGQSRVSCFEPLPSLVSYFFEFIISQSTISFPFQIFAPLNNYCQREFRWLSVDVHLALGLFKSLILDHNKGILGWTWTKFFLVFTPPCWGEDRFCQWKTIFESFQVSPPRILETALPLSPISSFSLKQNMILSSSYQYSSSAVAASSRSAGNKVTAASLPLSLVFSFLQQLLLFCWILSGYSPYTGSAGQGGTASRPPSPPSLLPILSQDKKQQESKRMGKKMTKCNKSPK